MKLGIFHAYTEDEILMFRDIHLHVDKFKKLEKPQEVGEVKDMNNPKDVKNIDKKKERGVTGYQEYEAVIDGTTWIIKTEIFKNKNESAYNLYKKKE